MATKKFELKAGVTIKCHKKGVDVNNENLTDELALALLKEKPYHKKNFIKLPDNVDELVKNYSFSPAIPAADDSQSGEEALAVENGKSSRKAGKNKEE